MTSASRIIISLPVGIFAGVLVWGLFFLLIGGLFLIGGNVQIEPVFTVSLKQFFPYIVGFGLIAGAVHGLFTELAVRIYRPGVWKACFIGFLVMQILYVISFLFFLVKFGDGLNCPSLRSSLFECLIGSLTDFVFFGLFVSVIVFIPSVLTGLTAGKAFSFINSKF